MDAGLENKYAELFNIDQRLDRLVRDIEFLQYLNPLNIEQEKKRFFSSKFSENPVFKYRKIKYDLFKMQRELFNLPIERIPENEIRSLYEDIIYEYSGLLECMAGIGQGKRFYYDSLKVFGTPKERDVENAKFILHFEDDENTDAYLKRYTADEAEAYFRNFGKLYGFDFKISQSTNISAAAMVINATATLLLKRNHLFSENELKVLSHHEIGLHLVTTYNGKAQPLKIFSNGFVNNVETQEGLAVFTEYYSGCLTMRRMKTLAYRVIATDSLIKGYSFCDTFDLLYGQYKLDRENAWKITLRTHRGGGFTKDYVYLTGLRKIYQLHRKSGIPNALLSGKVAMEDLGIIQQLMDLGLAVPNTYESLSLKSNKNEDSQIAFILKNLK